MSFGGVVISIVVSHVFMLNHATFYSAVEMRPNPECNRYNHPLALQRINGNSPSFWMYCIWFPLSFVFREFVRPYVISWRSGYTTRNIQGPFRHRTRTVSQHQLLSDQSGPSHRDALQSAGRESKDGRFLVSKEVSQENGGLKCWKIESCRQ